MLTLNLQIQDPLLLKVLTEILRQADVQVEENPHECDGILSYTPVMECDVPSVNLSTLNPPFRIADLLSLVHNFTYDQLLTFSHFCLNVRDRKLTNLKKAETFRLTGKECELLKFFYKNKGQEVSKDDLLKTIWDYHPDVATHTLETHIYRLRQKLEENPSVPQILLNCKDGYFFNVLPPLNRCRRSHTSEDMKLITKQPKLF